MTSQNLAAIFQPGLLSHPQHDMAPAEYRLSQDVIVFLIENQDHFLIGMRGTAADEKTVQDVQNGTPPVSAPSTPNPNRSMNSVGRTASNASAGADSLRRGGGIRRNVSVNSRHSRQSNGAPSPASPAYGAPLGHSPSGGVHRSNTVPSKKSPAVPSTRLQKSPGSRSPSAFASMNATTSHSPSPHPLGITAPIQESVTHTYPPESPNYPPTIAGASSVAPSSHVVGAELSQERLLDPTDAKLETPSKGGVFPNLFNRSPTTDPEKKQPNKLRKKRIPGTSNESAHSSTTSLHGPTGPTSPTLDASRGPDDTPEQGVLASIQSQAPILEHTDASPPIPQGPQQPILSGPSSHLAVRPEASHHSSDGTLKPQPSSNSLRSGDVSATDQSDMEVNEDPVLAAEQKEKRRRWRLSRKREDSQSVNYLTSPKKTNGAELSTSSFGSGKPRKSFSDAYTSGTGSEQGLTHASQTGFSDTSVKDEKKGPLGWFKDKMREAKEEKRARDADREQGSGRLGSHSESSGTSAPIVQPHKKSADLMREPGNASTTMDSSVPTGTGTVPIHAQPSTVDSNQPAEPLPSAITEEKSTEPTPNVTPPSVIPAETTTHDSVPALEQSTNTQQIPHSVLEAEDQQPHVIAPQT